MEPKSDVLSSQAELAALAAHLLAHQTRYHLDDAIDAEAKVLVPEVRAAVGSNMATPGGTRVATVDLWHTFSDAEEMEADSAAIIALQRANWDATALRTLWRRRRPSPSSPD
jgi:predicted Zn-dependent protease